MQDAAPNRKRKSERCADNDRGEAKEDDRIEHKEMLTNNKKMGGYNNMCVYV